MLPCNDLFATFHKLHEQLPAIPMLINLFMPGSASYFTH